MRGRHTPVMPLPRRLLALRERYLEYMTAALNQPIGDRVHLDKNPTLTLVLPGFLRLFPEARLLIALRDPRDVVISCFMQYLPLNPNSVCFLTLERTARRYATDMAVWRQLREMIASPWLEVRYEETVTDLEKEARRALEFLDLPWEPRPDPWTEARCALWTLTKLKPAEREFAIHHVRRILAFDIARHGYAEYVRLDVRRRRLVRVGDRDQRGEVEHGVRPRRRSFGPVGVADVREHGFELAPHRRLVQPAPRAGRCEHPILARGISARS